MFLLVGYDDLQRYLSALRPHRVDSHSEPSSHRYWFYWSWKYSHINRIVRLQPLPRAKHAKGMRKMCQKLRFRPHNDADFGRAARFR